MDDLKPKKLVPITQKLEDNRDALRKALPKWMDSEKFESIVLTCCRKNPDLFQCDTNSLMGAMFVSAQLGIEPIAGMAYLIPFFNNKKVGNTWVRTREVQFVLGYKGLVSLFHRHSKSVSLEWGVVYKNDYFEYQLGTSSFLNHVPARGDKGSVEGYWVVASLHGGGKVFHYMNEEDCFAHAKQHSKTWDKKKGLFYSSSPWSTSPESMCLKTVLIQLGKLLPMSTDLQKAILVDESARTYDEASKLDPIDTNSETNWETLPDDDIKSISEGMEK